MNKIIGKSIISQNEKIIEKIIDSLIRGQVSEMNKIEQKFYL